MPHALTTRQLVERTGVTAAAISQRVARAEAEGWVTRHRSDGRTVIVTLTDSGRTVIDGSAERIFQHEAELLAPLSPRQRSDLARLLKRLVAAHDPEHTGDEAEPS